MDSKQLEGLLQRYWDCETSLEEEQQLRDLFSKQEIPEYLKETAELFRYFEQQKKVTVHDSSFDTRLLGALKKPSGRLISFLPMARIAAGLLVVFVAAFFIRQEIKKANADEPEDTYSDPQLAFEETKKALMLISRSFYKAQKQTEKINLFNEAQQKIQKKERKKSNI